MSEIMLAVANSPVPIWLWFVSLGILAFMIVVMVPYLICMGLIRHAKRWYPNDQPRKPRDPERQRFYDQLYEASNGLPKMKTPSRTP